MRAVAVAALLLVWHALGYTGLLDMLLWRKLGGTVVSRREGKKGA